MNNSIYAPKIEDLIHKFKKVPFVHNGRSFKDGMDCLGFVILFYKEFGIDIPNDDGMPIEKNWYKKDPERYIRGIRSLEGTEVGIDELQPLDLVYFTINRNIVTHTGIVISEKEFLHTRPIRGFTRSSLEGPWRRRFRGAIRLINH